ncbi:MAG: cytochrome c3 family protein [Thermodesulfobacteriota bacterium]
MSKYIVTIIFSLLIISASMAVGRVGGGDIKYEVKRVGDVIFSHETHVELIGFNCTRCHPHIYLTKEQHKTVKMIHRRQAQSCGECHDGKQAFDLRSNCFVCHKREGK